jgi:hypothetical protein
MSHTTTPSMASLRAVDVFFSAPYLIIFLRSYLIIEKFIPDHEFQQCLILWDPKVRCHKIPKRFCQRPVQPTHWIYPHCMSWMNSVALILLVRSVCLLITSHNTLEPALCIYLPFLHFLSLCQVVLTVAGKHVHVVRSAVTKCYTFVASLLLVANIPFSVLFPKTSSPDNVTVTWQEAIKIVMSQPLLCAVHVYTVCYNKCATRPYCMHRTLQTLLAIVTHLVSGDTLMISKHGHDTRPFPFPLHPTQIYRAIIKSFPDYKHLLQENYVEYNHIFLKKCNSTQEVFLQLT